MRAIRLPPPCRKIAAISNCCPMMISRTAVSRVSTSQLQHMVAVGLTIIAVLAIVRSERNNRSLCPCANAPQPPLI